MENNKKLNDDNISVVYQKELNNKSLFESTNENINEIFDIFVESEDVLDILISSENSAFHRMCIYSSNEEYLKEKNISLSQYKNVLLSLKKFFLTQKIIDINSPLQDLNDFKLSSLPYGITIIETFSSIDYNNLDIKDYENIISHFIGYYQALINNLDNRKLQFIDVINKFSSFQEEYMNSFKNTDEDELSYFLPASAILKKSYIDDFLNIDVLNQIDTLINNNIIESGWGLIGLYSDNPKLPLFPIPYQTLVNNFLAEAKNKPQNCIKYVSSFIEFYKSKVELLEFHKETYNIAIQQIKETSNSIKLKYMNLLQKVKETPNSEYLKVSEWFKNRRLELGLTQKELSKTTSISQSMIAHIENGVHIPSFENAILLCGALEVNFVSFSTVLKQEMIKNFIFNLKETFKLKLSKINTNNSEYKDVQIIEGDNLTLSELVKNRRQELGFPLRYLSTISGISKAMIGNIENNVSKPSFENAILLCRALEIDAMYFLDKLQQELIDEYIEKTKKTFEVKLKLFPF